jgi:hypothetical protein
MKSIVNPFNSICFKGLPLILLGLLVGCVSVEPTTITKNDGPQKALPSRYSPPVGSIYNVGSYKPIFEGIKAKRVGDMVSAVQAALDWLAQPTQRQQAVLASRALALKHQGAAQRTAQALAPLLS